MAVVAIIATIYMGRVLADRNDSIVTRTASADNLSVVDGQYRLKGDRAMAIPADVGRLYVNRALARGGHAVVT